MNDMMNFVPNMSNHQPSITEILGLPNIRFRDVLQLLLLSMAVRIVSRAFQIMNRMGYYNALPMQMPQQPQPILLQYPQMPAPDRKDV